MISIIITAFKEPKTIANAVKSTFSENLPPHEILVIAPDKETLNEAKKTKIKTLKTIKDDGKGKPAALNLAIKKSKGEILILTDGDVFLDKNAIPELLKEMQNKKIGAVSGRPVSTNAKSNKFGYWAFLLTNIAHIRRKRAVAKNKRFFPSGYLFTIRKNLFPNLNEELLSEDGFISHEVYKKGFKISYAEKAKVYVKYPTTFKDWIIQKKRSAGGYNQIKKLTKTEIRSLKSESKGFLDFLKLVSSPKEFFWLIHLFVARIYLWYLIYRDINVKKKSREEIWKRVESTK